MLQGWRGGGVEGIVRGKCGSKGRGEREMCVTGKDRGTRERKEAKSISSLPKGQKKKKNSLGLQNTSHSRSSVFFCLSQNTLVLLSFSNLNRRMIISNILLCLRSCRVIRFEQVQDYWI